MAKDEYPSVFVVDSHTTRPPIPPRLNQGRRRAGAAQTLLFLLVGVALCGMVIEACFIFRLYQTESASSASSSKFTGGEDATSPTMWPSYNILPSKPVAHLTDGQDAHHGSEIMAWSMIADPLLYEMQYKGNSLIIQKEGYYYVYSKVYFSDNGVFHHTINRNTEKYSGKSITLLQSRSYSPVSKSKIARSNSYLGGVFHLDKNDALCVKVSNTSKIEKHKAFENIFGAYMI
ncbi:tumor necrosis factor ligand superfamily member 14 [Lates calcarifer]|uniref:TNF superfamily member 14 n=1 Tax=Lates calcarifer TaxID=8187 RepID=A0A4W6FU25_LATCA|nr:tumor necrosis factor ligand superfamily member 14 [Lates calcarifer]XP_018560115.1 tumor necrosis factor ligand superfamily member 14 [Lates calcarifer]